MSFVDILGWVCAVVGAFYAMPQFVRVCRTRTTAGLSQIGWQLQSAGAISWVGHGIIYSLPHVIACNLVVAWASLGVIGFIIAHRRLSVLPVLTPIVAVGVLLSGVDLVAGQVAYGLLVVVPVLVGLIAQLIDIIGSPDVQGVSPAFLALGIVIQSLWFSWSLLKPDHAVALVAGVTGVVLTANLVALAIRRSGVGPASGLGTRSR